MKREGRRMNGLVEIRRNDAITDSMRIAEGTENQHHAVQQIIRKYSEKFERWGRLEFTHLKCGKRGRPAKVYILNEGQRIKQTVWMNFGDFLWLCNPQRMLLFPWKHISNLI